jgi:arylsulfatase A-like enzyme/Tfp pilus assembly protein PilF
VATALGAPLADDKTGPSPSLLLVTLDTTRADRLGCYGADGAGTPRLDALARAGVRFERALSPAPLTAPAHASLMTGRVPRRHGVRDNALYPLPGDVPLLAELLAAAGYDTAAAVSSAVLDRGLGLDRGFGRYDDQVRVGPRSAFDYEERAASQTNAAALAELERLRPPFFLWVHYFDPHLPWLPPPPFDRRFAASPYDGEIAFMDRELGRLLDAAAGRAERLLVVAAGDHGESLGEHGERAHGVFLYQATQRVPLIVAGPGIPRGRVVDAPVGLVDLLPTLLELLGVAAPDGLDGRSLAAALAAGSDRRRLAAAELEMESHFPRLAYGWASLRALARGELVLIDAPRPELYDLAADPGEERNLWPDHPSAAGLMRDLRALTADDEPAAAALDPELAERRMRVGSLGYTGGGGARETDGIDPKDGIELLAMLDEARATVQTGRPADAVELLGVLLRRNPRNVPAWLTLLAARLAGGDPAAAVSAGRRAVELSPDDDLVRFNLANALAAESARRPAAVAEAREQYERALRINPRRADAYLNYAALLSRAEEYGAARALLGRAAEAGVDGPDLRVERGVLALRAGDVDEAVRLFEGAVALNPADSQAWEALVRIALRRGRHDEARRLLERWREAGASDPAGRDRLRALERSLDDGP